MEREENRRAALERALLACLDDSGLRPGLLAESPASWVDRQADRLTALGAFVLSPDSADYPHLLIGIENEPTHLFARGRRPAAAQPGVAIVGSRRPTPSGLRFAAETARLLVRHGLAVVSGLARGIDGEAHRAALASAGDALPTIGVMATGLDVVYPPEHRHLQEAVATRGLVLTEFPPGAPPLRHHFLRRNRLLSGLAQLVVVVEARARSGALVTVGHALSQGRDVGAVPGDPFSEASVGSNRLLADGASPLVSPEAVLQKLIDGGQVELARLSAVAAGNSVDATRPTDADHAEWRGLKRWLSSRPATPEELAAHTGRPVASLLADLTELEMAGCVRRWHGGFVRA